MLLALTEDQQMLRDVAADFVAARLPVKRSRDLRMRHVESGFQREAWKEMASLGWAGIPIPEAFGGAGLGFAEIVVVMEALGRTLAPEPFLSSVLLGAMTIVRQGTDVQRADLLPRICAGELLVAFAHEESSMDRTQNIQTVAEPDGSGWRLSGTKLRVLDASTADQLMVSAQLPNKQAGNPSLFLVPAGSSGVFIAPFARVDSRNVATITLNNVHVDADGLIGHRETTDALIEELFDYATIGVCAETLGLMSAAFDSTLEHLRTRIQFDVPIGSFQALQHRAAICFVKIELARSLVMAAARKLDEDPLNAARFVSAAKACCSDAAVLVTNEALQMHGGMGMTDECDIGLYVKRARAAAHCFGDSDWHRARFALLSGF